MIWSDDYVTDFLSILAIGSYTEKDALYDLYQTLVVVNDTASFPLKGTSLALEAGPAINILRVVGLVIPVDSKNPFKGVGVGTQVP